MITAFSFGRITVDGTIYSHDIKIVQGQVVSEWWRKSGHRVDIEDITDILQAKPDTLVLGKGDPGLMKSSRLLREYLETHSVELIEKKTSEAIRVFNTLVQEDRRVAAGFHVGC